MKHIIIMIVVTLLCSGLSGCRQESSSEPAPATSESQEANFPMITGTVTYRERIALSPQATMKIALQDVSRADAKAEVIASQEISPVGQVPVSFKLDFDEGRIDERMTYALSVRIEDRGRLQFINDSRIPVLTRGAGNEVDVLLKRVESQNSDRGGQAVDRGQLLRGQFSYMADAARFVDCRSGKSFPVSMEGAYRELEKTYLASDVEPGSPLLVDIFGKFLERPGMEEGTRAVQVIVDEFKGIAMDNDCTPNRQASLENTRWKLVELADGQAVNPGDTTQEPLLTLRAGEKQANGSGGCNNFFGPYNTSDDQLSFGALGSTMKLCPFGMEIEAAFHKALGETTRYSISGEFLTLYADDKAVAKLEAIYL